MACGSSKVLDGGLVVDDEVVSVRADVGEFTSREWFESLVRFFFSKPPKDGIWWNRSRWQLIGVRGTG